MFEMQKIKIVKIKQDDNSFTIRTITGNHLDKIELDFEQYKEIDELMETINTGLDRLGYDFEFEIENKKQGFVLYIQDESVLQVYDTNTAG